MNTNQSTPKALYRSRKQRIIAGVCGGLAEYFNIDVAIIRIIWLLSLLFHGIGIPIYIVFALAMKNAPDESVSSESDENKKPAKPEAVDDTNRSNTWLVALILMIVFILLWTRIFHNPFPRFMPHFSWDWALTSYDDLLALVIIIIGVIFVASKLTSQAEGQARSATLERSRDNRMIGGVCAGLAELWQIDVTWIRLGYLVLSLATNVLLGIIIYLILMIIIPEKKINQ